MDSGKRRDRPDDPNVRRVQELYDANPGMRAAVEQRLSEIPEYRTWLQQHGHAVLEALANTSAEATEFPTDSEFDEAQDDGEGHATAQADDSVAARSARPVPEFAR